MNVVMLVRCSEVGGYELGWYRVMFFLSVFGGRFEVLVGFDLRYRLGFGLSDGRVVIFCLFFGGFLVFWVFWFVLVFLVLGNSGVFFLFWVWEGFLCWVFKVFLGVVWGLVEEVSFFNKNLFEIIACEWRLEEIIVVFSL